MKHSTAEVGSVEIWSLYNGNKLQSTPGPKCLAQKWMEEELTVTTGKTWH